MLKKIKALKIEVDSNQTAQNNTINTVNVCLRSLPTTHIYCQQSLLNSEYVEKKQKRSNVRGSGAIPNVIYRFEDVYS